MPEHNHAPASRESHSKNMRLVLALTGSFMLVEAATGFYTGSLALLADAGHMLSDVAALVLALVAIWFAGRPANAGKTYGYYRTEILAGLANAIALVVISIFILIEAAERLKSPPEVASGPMLAVAVVGLVVNLISVKLLHGSAAESLNVKAAYLEVLGDLFATVGVIAAAAIMYFTHWYLADPIVSGLIGLMILPRTWLLLSEATNILMEGAPGHVDIGRLRESLLTVDGVTGVHDLHVWTITSGKDAMTAHVTIGAQSVAETVLDAITAVARDEFELHHTTVQIEQTGCAAPGSDGCGA